jgi:ABC-type transporter Mla subunit MlaD
VNTFHKVAQFFQQLGDATARFPEAFEMIHSIKKELTKMRQEIQDAFAELQSQVAEVRNNEEAAAKLLDGLHQQLIDALNSSNDPTEIVSNIQGIASQLKQDTDALAAAVASGSPTPAPAPAPADTGTGTGDTSGTGTADTGTGTGDAGTGTGEATDPTA